jgi:hypothetical protein
MLQHPLFLDALQAPLQKIDLQYLLADFAFQLRDAPFRLPLLPVSEKHIAWRLAKPPAAWHVGVHFQATLPRPARPLLEPLDHC